MFAIPFKIDAPRSAAQRPTGVQLHVSEDGGASWRLYEQVDPAISKFTFRAPHDGDYLFFVRTLDSAGRLQPATPPSAELRVVVDTLAPRLELEAQQAPSGEVTATWRMLDRNLRPESFRLEFQSHGDSTWQPVNVPRPMPGQRVETGEVSFWPGADSADITIRAQVIDQAGNPAVAQRALGSTEQPHTTPFHAAASRKPEHPSNSDNPLNWQAIDDEASPGSVRWNPSEFASEPLVGRREARTEEIGPPPAAEAVGVGERLPDLTGAPSSSVHFGTTSTGVNRLPPSARDSELEPPPASFYEELPPSEPLDAEPLASDTSSNDPDDLVLPTQPQQPSIPEPELTVDALKQGFDRSTAAKTSDKAQPRRSALTLGDFDHLPPGEQPLMVNSRRFEFDYEVDASDTVSIDKVEVWGTRDGGQTWSSFGIDEDNRSPVSVSVDREGLYGFRLIVEAAGGIRSLPPRAGDAPDIWVGVDLTKPKLELLEAVAQPEDGFGALVVRWRADDVMLASNPISIHFSERSSGPWTTVADRLDNVGEFTWKIDQQLPDRIYLQLQARDAAGNVATVESPEPISLARLRPQGRIREVRPSKEAQRSTSWSIVR